MGEEIKKEVTADELNLAELENVSGGAVPYKDTDMSDDPSKNFYLWCQQRGYTDVALQMLKAGDYRAANNYMREKVKERWPDVPFDYLSASMVGGHVLVKPGYRTIYC